jgi:hypothetical protein
MRRNWTRSGACWITLLSQRPVPARQRPRNPLLPLLALFDARDVLATSVTRPTTLDKIRFHFRPLRDLPAALAASYVFERMCTIARGLAKTLWWIAYGLCREAGKPLPVALRNRSYSLGCVFISPGLTEDASCISGRSTARVAV